MSRPAAHPLAFRRRAGFSLIEMLITLALLIVMMTMYYGFGSRSHQREQQKRCQSNLQKIYIALQLYANDFHGSFPLKTNAQTSEDVLQVLVPRYTTDSASFICPGSKDNAIPMGEPIGNRKISYAYFMGRRANESQEPLMSDKLASTKPVILGQAAFSTDGKPPGNNHHKYGGNFLFCDGRSDLYPAKLPFSLVFSPNVVLLNPKP